MPTASNTTRAAPRGATDRHSRIMSLYGLLGANHGAASLDQVRSLGFTRSAIDHLVHTGTLRRAGPGVFIAGAAPNTWHQQLQIAALTPGVLAISHHTAARLHGLAGVLQSHASERYRRDDDAGSATDPVEVLVERGARPHVDDSVIVHFTRADPVQVRTGRTVCIDSIPVLDLGTVICQMAEVLDAAALRSTVVAVLSTGSLSQRRERLRQITEAVRWWRCPGRRGPRLVADALVAVGLGAP